MRFVSRACSDCVVIGSLRYADEKEKEGSGLDEHLLQDALLEGLRILELCRHQLNFAVEGRKEVSDLTLLDRVGDMELYLQKTGLGKIVAGTALSQWDDFSSISR